MDWISLAVALLFILGFITWMFWEMAGNTQMDQLPRCFIRFSGDNRTDWIFAFVFLNIFTACYYFFRVYRTNK